MSSAEMQFLAGWVWHGQQVGDDLAGQVVAAELLRRDPLGLVQRGDGLGDLAALGVGMGYVDHHAGAPLGRQPGCINGLGGLQGSSGVAELDRDGDLE